MHILNRGLIPLLCFALFVTAGSCKKKRSRQTNWNINLNRNNKNPYGLFLAYHSLNYLFPEAALKDLKGNSRLTHLGNQLKKNEGRSLVIIIGYNLNFSNTEIDSLLSFARQGHQVLLSARNFSDSLLDRFHIALGPAHGPVEKKIQNIYIRGENDKEKTFPYQHYNENLSGSFTTPKAKRQQTISSLGSDDVHESNYLVCPIGRGKIFLHAAPLAFSNHFLLQEQNRAYLSTLFSYISDPVHYIYWSGNNSRTTYHSNWSVVWRHPSTRYALLISLFALLVFVIFQMKRRQKIIPVLPPLENTSVAFVETIGRLYYNKKNHSNLAEKMIQHFLDFVRNAYMLNTSLLDSSFIQSLSTKSGIPLNLVESLVQRIHEVHEDKKISSADLQQLYKEIQIFYHGK